MESPNASFRKIPDALQALRGGYGTMLCGSASLRWFSPLMSDWYSATVNDNNQGSAE